MMQPDLDRRQFSEDVSRWLENNGLSYREAVGLHPCLNPAMLSRACTEQVLSAASMLLLCHVIGLDPLRYLIIPECYASPTQRNQAVTAIESRETARGDGDRRWA